MSLLLAAENAALILLAGISAWTDWKHRRVPNRLTLPFLGLGVLFSAMRGIRELTVTIVLVIGVLLLGFVLFAIGAIGGGDAKLAAAIGALRGPEFLAESMLWVVLLGLALSLLILAARRDLFPFLGRLVRAGYQMVAWRLLPSEEVVREGGRKIPLAMVIAAGAVLALAMEFLGRSLMP